MTKDKEGYVRALHVGRIALCGGYATTVLEATVLERLRLLAQLRVALWRLRWTLRVASRLSFGADAYRAGPVGHVEVLAAKA